jgi:beta-aspartyl-peptidase (threonine type)
MSLLSASAALALVLTTTPAIDDAPVRAVLDAQLAAWNRGDLDTFMQTYWKSPDLVFQSNASTTRGWQATLERYRKRYLSEGKEMGQLRFDELDVDVLAPGVAFARGAWHLRFRDGRTANGCFTLLLRERTEGWRIVYDHSSGE